MKTKVLDLAIVGAGLAGLGAAQRARELGISAEIFEASDGVGGRIRTDRVGEFICDRGFQLINPAYPALSRFYEPKEFHHLQQGIEVVRGDRVYRLGDPRSSLGYISGDISSATGTLAEKLRFARYLLEISRGDNRATDQSFEEEMLEHQIDTFYARVIGPFASGVFLNHPSRISARVARELIHYFMIGKPGVPQGGVGEVSRQLAEGLIVHVNSPVDSIGEDHLRIGRRRIKARAVIVATDAIAAYDLLQSSLHSPRMKKISISRRMSGSTTWYHSVERDDFSNLLRIDSDGSGPVTNTIAISNLAPEYAPAGKTLVSTTVMSAYGEEVSEVRVRKHLSHLWKMKTDDWNLVAKYAIPRSLPLIPPGLERQVSLELPVKRGSMLRFLAGDFLSVPAQQGAMESGIDAAEEVAAKL